MNWTSLLSSQRIGQTKPSTMPSRSVFEQDYDRIIFSHPFRRLQDKTQVHPLPEHDFVHTRLTHSLEVSSVGRSLGKKVGETILQRHAELHDYSAFDIGAIVAAASLAHDLGNPPFGHAGEDSISDFFAHHPVGQAFQHKVGEAEWIDLTKFEGNAQGFRILNKDYYQGLRLSYATLGAFTKYPCPAKFDQRDKKKKSQKKYGFFQTEAALFARVAKELDLPAVGNQVWSRHPLAFLVEAADDICYSIIDLEDGCRLGLVSYDNTVELLASILKEDFSREKLSRVVGQNEQIGVLRAMVIGRLIDECSKVFLDAEQEILGGNFDTALTDLCASADQLRNIAIVSIEKIYRARHVVEIEAAGHEVLPGLLEEFVQAAGFVGVNPVPKKFENLLRLLPAEIKSELNQAASEYERLRTIIDFVSGLTDRHALSLYRKIKGIALS